MTTICSIAIAIAIAIVAIGPRREGEIDCPTMVMTDSADCSDLEDRLARPIGSASV
jgi:hypothetical protein